MVGRLVVERRLQASRGLLMALQREFGRIVIVLYDDVFWVGRIGDETLTWVHKHNGITGMGRQPVDNGEFATGDGEWLYSRDQSRRPEFREFSLGLIVAVL